VSDGAQIGSPPIFVATSPSSFVLAARNFCPLGEFPDFKIDTVSDLPRIMRLPGTINIPDASKRSQGELPAPEIGFAGA
jgi:hypothetical protein